MQGIYKTIEDATNMTVAVAEKIHPNTTLAGIYEEIYPVFTSLYQSLKNDYRKLFDINNG